MFKKIIHITLVLLLLISLSGISISFHYCSGELISTAVNKDARSCCDDSGSCCENRTIHFEIKDQFETPFNNQIAQQNVQIIPCLQSLIIIDFETEDERPAFKTFNDSSPPLNIRTRLAFIQTYLL